MPQILLFLCLLLSGIAQAELIDKIAGVFEDKIFSLSEVNQVKSHLKARNNISPQIFDRTDLSSREIVEILIDQEIVKKKLEEIGYIIGDEQVESQIRSTEQRLQLSRNQLVQFIENNGLKFTEYFEIIRSTIEYNIFLQRVISPLIAVSDQEILTEFNIRYPKKKAESFIYNLEDFRLPKFKKNKKNIQNVKKSIAKYIQNKTKDKFLEKAEISSLDEVEEDGLNAKMKSAIVKTQVKGLSDPIYLGDAPHIFHVKSKTVTYSAFYKSQRDMLRNFIAQKEINKVVKIWLKREHSKYFRKVFL
jgi:peptidyl-prolyl cis-trans isomerase SurA